MKYFCKVFYFVIFKILFCTILFSILKILLKSILPITAPGGLSDKEVDIVRLGSTSHLNRWIPGCNPSYLKQSSLIYILLRISRLSGAWPDDATESVVEQESSRLQPSIDLHTSFTVLMFNSSGTDAYYPEQMKVRVSPVPSLKPHRVLALTRDLNQGPPGPLSQKSR